MNDIYDQGNHEHVTYTYYLQRYVDGRWITLTTSRRIEEVYADAERFKPFHEFTASPWRILTERETTRVTTTWTDQDPPLDNGLNV